MVITYLVLIADSHKTGAFDFIHREDYLGTFPSQALSLISFILKTGAS